MVDVHVHMHVPHACNVHSTLPLLSRADQGFEFYDTMTSSLLSGVTFENYRYRYGREHALGCEFVAQQVTPPYTMCCRQYTTNPGDWWYNQTPHAFRMLSHSDQFKPGEGA